MNIFVSLFTPIVDAESESKGIPCFYESVIKALSEQGNNIFVHISHVWNSDYNTIPGMLLEEINSFKPDLFILFNNTFYEVPHSFESPVVIWEVDSPPHYANKKAIVRNASRYKFIVSQEESIAKIHELYGVEAKNVLLAPFFTEIRAQEEVPCASNITFIGSFFGEGMRSPVTAFLEKNPEIHEVNAYRRLLQMYVSNPQLSLEELVDRTGDVPDRVVRQVSLPLWEVAISCFSRIKTLSAVEDLGLTIYGTKGWVTAHYFEPWLSLAYNPRKVYTLAHNQEVYNATKIGININHLQAQSGFSWRVCDIMASNACLVSEYKPNLLKYFPDVGLPLFDNPYDARTICQQLLKDEQRRRDIVSASQEAIDRGFRFKNVQCLIEQFLGISLTTSPPHTVTPEIIYRVQKFTLLSKISKKMRKWEKRYVKNVLAKKEPTSNTSSHS